MARLRSAVISPSAFAVFSGLDDAADNFGARACGDVNPGVGVLGDRCRARTGFMRGRAAVVLVRVGDAVALFKCVGRLGRGCWSRGRSEHGTADGRQQQRRNHGTGGKKRVHKSLLELGLVEMPRSLCDGIATPLSQPFAQGEPEVTVEWKIDRKYAAGV